MGFGKTVYKLYVRPNRNLESLGECVPASPNNPRFSKAGNCKIVHRYYSAAMFQECL